MSDRSGDLMQLGAMVRRNALRFGDREAYVSGAHRLTWKAVDQRSDRLAAVLRAGGVRKGDHVAIFGHSGHKFILASFALYKLGAVVVLLNVALKGRHLVRQLTQADVSAVLTGDGLQETMNAIRGEVAVRFFTWDPGIEGSIDLSPAMEAGDEAPPQPIEPVAPEDPAVIVFSSGTTGSPKGAVNTCLNVLAKDIGFALNQELRQTDTGMLLTPVCMGGTQFLSINPYALLGMKCVIMPSFDAGKALSLIESEKVNTFFAVPLMLNAMTLHADFETRNLESWDKVISAGAALPLEVYQRLTRRGIKVFECCGTSESGGGLMISAGEKLERPTSVGRPMVGFQVCIFDESNREVAADVVGEIVMRGDAVASGYYKQPEIHAEAYAEGWFHTGDLGRRDAAGYFYLVDRKKDMINTGGTNVYPRDLEEVIYELPDVIECAVVGLPHPLWGEAVTAFVVKRPSSEVDEATVMARLRDTLANYQVPKALLFVDALPKTVFGKLYKAELRQRYAEYYTAP